MGFMIFDLEDKSRFKSVNFWNWRPTLALISSFKLLDDERLERMGMSCVGATVTQSEARAIAKALRERVLPGLGDADRVKLDLAVTGTPDDGTLYRGDETEKNYSATRAWLQEFAEFCETCRGFKI